MSLMVGYPLEFMKFLAVMAVLLIIVLSIIFVFLALFADKKQLGIKEEGFLFALAGIVVLIIYVLVVSEIST
jgi:hypothetical protein